MTRKVGNTVNVFANNILISCKGDVNTVHKKPGSPCPAHAAPITSGSSSVFIGGDGAGRIGDGLTGCTAVAAGSPDVFIGG
tara:strand:+ start:3769 stop:4011 length:243 start_codon:yes stop_codon:yes gene_type:complete